jgi:hypothetical protein
MRRRWRGLGLLRAAERFRRIKRRGELGTLVTALGAGTAAERAARVVVATVDERARATIGSGSIFPSGSLVGIPCAAVN